MRSGTVFTRGAVALVLGWALCSPAPAQEQRRYTTLETDFGATHIIQWLQYANAFCGASKGNLGNMTVTWTGACRDGWLEGSGTLRVNNGSWAMTFNGAFMQGHAEGQAQIAFGDGPLKSFSGVLHDSLPNGPGAIVETNGRRIAGDYVYDSITGPITVDYIDGGQARFVLGGRLPQNPSTQRFADGAILDVDAVTLVTLPSGTGVYSGGFAHLAYPDGSRLTASVFGAEGDAVYCGVHGVRYAGRMIWARPDGSQPQTHDYPALSRRLNEQGIVEISLVIGRDGSKSAITLHRSSGSERLDDAALAALANWRYLPATVDGHPIPMNLIVSVTYDLRPPYYNGGDSPLTVVQATPEIEHWAEQQRHWMRKSCAALR